MDEKPKVPKRVRSAAYFISLAVGAISLISLGVAEAYFPTQVEPLTTVFAAVTAATTLVSGGLGAIYRPTKDTAYTEEMSTDDH